MTRFPSSTRRAARLPLERNPILSGRRPTPRVAKKARAWLERQGKHRRRAGSAALATQKQAEAREEQRRLNAELRATRALLGESVRVNERTRISRELHDLLGHHLTA
ncbi:MAG TPA: histidine kinase, partial [Polyangiaceae bacterium]|nr:histidine kinase [Polyangiaceae bacterium]